MKLHRVYAIILRHFFLLRRSYEHMMHLFYWVSLDLVLWGITSTYFQNISGTSQNLVFMIISGVLFWNIVQRTQLEINIGVLEELWNKNLVNLFVSPLKIKELTTALTLMGFVKATISLIVGSIVAFILYKTNISIYSYHILAFIALLMLTGVWVGFFISSFLVRFGTRAEIIAWSFVWILTPFSAVYFPLSALPQWAQFIAKFIPTSYIFEEARNLLFNGIIDYP
ncbi:MAG: hypothetical protein US54_C0018G0001 [Candidatus Roizmanbacteria bacterium GW2011_GWA2_37_7]|uniref:ABC-2 type transporter transmembrane domain-containing protein n=1 Tax=Candidatus Roizmanbacteria bacterium GW2011_GWA2_37_7 TaxID=1618481 RepID=A0A0G0H493_9BACT|nr:MAG: hypothetical protein US54_C0018G0001 [Candidatus Roizmanbacteria bacterium GW2011_GWA2_37_7]